MRPVDHYDYFLAPDFLSTNLDVNANACSASSLSRDVT